MSERQQIEDDSISIGAYSWASLFLVKGLSLGRFGIIALTTSLYVPRCIAFDRRIDLRFSYALLAGFGVVFCFLVFEFHSGPPVKCQRILETVPGDSSCLTAINLPCCMQLIQVNLINIKLI